MRSIISELLNEKKLFYEILPKLKESYSISEDVDSRCNSKLLPMRQDPTILKNSEFNVKSALNEKI